MKLRTKVFIAVAVFLGFVALTLASPVLGAYVFMAGAPLLLVWGLIASWKRFVPASWKQGWKFRVVLALVMGVVVVGGTVWGNVWLYFVAFIALLLVVVELLWGRRGSMWGRRESATRQRQPTTRPWASRSPISQPRTSRPPIPDHIKGAVWGRDGGACVQCGSTQNLSFDHIIPYSLGGDDSVENLQVLCKSCLADLKADADR